MTVIHFAMLSRSLGAGVFSIFWQAWNPTQGFYLRNIFNPLKVIMPQAWSLIITFDFGGFIRDLAIMVIKWQFASPRTPWFLFIEPSVVFSGYANIDYSNFFMDSPSEYKYSHHLGLRLISLPSRGLKIKLSCQNGQTFFPGSVTTDNIRLRSRCVEMR